jgi:hypothetical protein
MAFFESRVFILTIRVIQALLTILILGLTGYGKPIIAANLAEDVANQHTQFPTGGLPTGMQARPRQSASYCSAQ